MTVTALAVLCAALVTASSERFLAWVAFQRGKFPYPAVGRGG